MAMQDPFEPFKKQMENYYGKARDIPKKLKKAIKKLNAPKGDIADFRVKPEMGVLGLAPLATRRMGRVGEEIDRATDRVVDSSSLGFKSYVDKKQTGKTPKYASKRKFKNDKLGSSLDFVADYASLISPTGGAKGAVKATGKAAKQVTEEIAKKPAGKKKTFTMKYKKPNSFNEDGAWSGNGRVVAEFPKGNPNIPKGGGVTEANPGQYQKEMEELARLNKARNFLSNIEREQRKYESMAQALKGKRPNRTYTIDNLKTDKPLFREPSGVYEVPEPFKTSKKIINKKAVKKLKGNRPKYANKPGTYKPTKKEQEDLRKFLDLDNPD